MRKKLLALILAAASALSMAAVPASASSANIASGSGRGGITVGSSREAPAASGALTDANAVEITNLELQFAVPSEDTAPPATFPAPTGTALDGNIAWRVKDGAPLNAGDTFKRGNVYQAVFALVPEANYAFSGNMTAVVKDVIHATADVTVSNSNRAEITVTFPVFPTRRLKGTAKIGIDMPVAGAQPDTQFKHLYQMTAANIKWEDVDGRPVDANGFEKGKRYRVSFALVPNVGYELDVADFRVVVPGADVTIPSAMTSVFCPAVATFPAAPAADDRKAAIFPEFVRYDRRAGGNLRFTVTDGTGVYALSPTITVTDGAGGRVLDRDVDYRYEPVSQTSTDYQLTLLERYLRTLPVGKANITLGIRAASPAAGVDAAFTLSIDVYASSASSSSSSPSSSGGSDRHAPDDPAVRERVSGVSANVSSLTGAVKETAAVRDVEKAVLNASGSDADVSVTVRNARTISAKALDAMADAAAGRPVTLHADKVRNGAIVSRLYIDVGEAARQQQDWNLDVSIGSKPIEKLFDQHFTNHIAVVSFGQKGSFGMEIRVAVKVDLSKLDAGNLVFYSFNAQTNRYSRITPKYYVDRNGYLHFSVMDGGSVIITDSPLTLK